MMDLFGEISVKHLAMFAGALMSALFSVDLTWLQRVFAFAAGLIVAAMCTDPLLSYLDLSDAWVNVVAGTLALSGNNLVRWVLRVSKDPGQIVARLRGGK